MVDPRVRFPDLSQVQRVRFEDLLVQERFTPHPLVQTLIVVLSEPGERPVGLQY